jgi:hypothetical protein
MRTFPLLFKEAYHLAVFASFPPFWAKTGWFILNKKIDSLS